MYVRNAAGLVQDKARLLHWLLLIFLLTWYFRKVILWPLHALWTGMNYEDLPVGKFCMMTNLTSSWDGNKDLDFNKKSIFFKLIILVSQSLYSLVLIYSFLASLRAR